MVDSSVTTATAPETWKGPFAQQVTADLMSDQKKLRRMASDLQHDAGSWARAADRLEAKARHLEGGGA
ncbi:hypothetical protein [Mangrovactinospora gilvigrisea]|nr:hypothetical protein [Mangrovactinospora gilvigrisea]